MVSKEAKFRNLQVSEHLQHVPVMGGVIHQNCLDISLEYEKPHTSNSGYLQFAVLPFFTSDLDFATPEPSKHLIKYSKDH